MPSATAGAHHAVPRNDADAKSDAVVAPARPSSLAPPSTDRAVSNPTTAAELSIARHHSHAGPVIRPEDVSTIFPARIANLITALATSARLSLRLSAFFVEVILEGSQYGTRVSLGYTRRILISAISSARRVYLASNAALDGDLLAAVGLTDGNGKGSASTDAFLNVLDRWTNLGIYVIHHTFTLAELFAMSSFYLTANTVQSASFAAHESVTLFDSLFGSNESSRALASIITLVRRELLDDDRFKAAEKGRVATLTALTKALTAFACLQNATWHSTSKRLRMKVLYDCTVLTSSDEFSAKQESVPEIDGAPRRQKQISMMETPRDADGDVQMVAVAGPASPTRPKSVRNSRTLAPTPDASEGADMDLLLQLEDLVATTSDEPFATQIKRRAAPPPPVSKSQPSSPENRRRHLKRVHTDTFEITDEFSESTVVTQTLERLGTPRERQRKISSTADVPEVLIEAVDEDVDMSDESDKHKPPATPMQTPAAEEEDETEWIEVDQLLDKVSPGASDITLPSEPNGIVASGAHPEPPSPSSERIQLVLRTMTNKLLQRKRTVRRVSRLSPSPSPSPPPTERDRDLDRERDRERRSRSPLASSTAAPVVAPIAAHRDHDSRRDVRSIDWTRSAEPGRSSSPRTSPGKKRAAATSASPPPNTSPNKLSAAYKGKMRAGTRRSMAALRDPATYRNVLRGGKPREPFPGSEAESSGTVTPTPGSPQKPQRTLKPEPPTPRQPASRPPPPSIESPPTSPTTLRAAPRPPPPSPYVPRRIAQESMRTRSSRIQASTSQVFSVGQRDTAANLFPHEPLIKNIHRFMRYSSAAYGQNFLRIFGLGNADFNFPTTGRHHANSWAFAQHTNIAIDALLLSSYTESYSPAFAQEKVPPLVHYIAVEHSLQAIVLTCRGTLGLSDVLVDLTCDYREISVDGGQPEGAYFVHSGMYESALQLTAPHSRVHQTLVEAMEQWPNYGLVLCGHSLGGGVAALLAINSSVPADVFMAQNAAREQPVRHPRITTPFVTSFASGLPPGRPIHCYGYGVPAVASADLASYSSGLITSVVQNADVVPTLSLGVLRDLKNIAVTLFEEGGVAEEIVGRVMGLNKSKFGADTPAEEEQMLADWMMSLIKTMRADMDNDKLFPPGSVYIMEYFDVFVTTDEVCPSGDHKATSSRQAQRVILRQCDSVQERFREPLFSKTMLNDHLPSHYERSTQLLYEGLGQGLL